MTAVILLDGRIIAEADASGLIAAPPAITHSKTVPFTSVPSDGALAYLFETGQATPHTITATLNERRGCSEGGQYGISELSLDVVRMR